MRKSLSAVKALVAVMPVEMLVAAEAGKLFCIDVDRLNVGNAAPVIACGLRLATVTIFDVAIATVVIAVVTLIAAFMVVVATINVDAGDIVAAVPSILLTNSDVKCGVGIFAVLVIVAAAAADVFAASVVDATAVVELGRVGDPVPLLFAVDPVETAVLVPAIVTAIGIVIAAIVDGAGKLIVEFVLVDA